MVDQKEDTVSSIFSSIARIPMIRTLQSNLLQLLSCCPFTMLGKRIIRIVGRELVTPEHPLNNREHYLLGKIRIGYGIILIGVVCPVFWLSFFSGARGIDLAFKAGTSLLVILFGVLYTVMHWLQLHKERSFEDPDKERRPG